MEAGVAVGYPFEFDAWIPQACTERQDMIRHLLYNKCVILGIASLVLARPGIAEQIDPQNARVAGATDAHMEAPDKNRPVTKKDVYTEYQKGHKLWVEGHIAEAVPYVKEAVRLASSIFDENDLYRADLHNRLGLLYYETGQFALAENQFRYSLKARTARLGPDHPLVGECLNNLAVQLKEQGRFGQSETPLRQALAIQEKVNPGKPIVADFADNLAFVMERLERWDEASELFNRAFQIYKEHYGINSPITAQSLRNLAQLRHRAGDLTEARHLYEQSLAIFKQTKGLEDRKVALGLNSLAILEMDEGKASTAITLWEDCVAIQTKNTQIDDPEISVALATQRLAIAYGCLNKWSKAAETMDLAVRAYIRHVATSLPSQPEPDQLAFLETAFEPTLQSGLSLGLAIPSDEKIRELSADWVLNGKGVAHRTLAERALLARDESAPETAALARELTAIRDERARLRYLNRGREDKSELDHKAAGLVEREQALIRSIGELRGRVSSPEPVRLSAVREAIPPDAVLIEIARFPRERFDASQQKLDIYTPRNHAKLDEVYAAWIIPAKGRGAVRIVDLGSAGEVDDAVWEVRQALDTGLRQVLRQGEEAAEDQLAGPLDRLSRLVLHPLLDTVGPVDRWLISPDADLWMIPWIALRLPSGRYVVEEHRLSYVLSGRDLVADRPKAPPSAPLMLADPDFDYLPPKITSSLVPDILWSRLPGTAIEAKAVAPALQKITDRAPNVLTGAAASEAAFKRASNPRIVVLSTHGFFLDDRPSLGNAETRGGSVRGVFRVLSESAADAHRPRLPSVILENPLLRCGVVLAGANRPTGRRDLDDGILTGLEIIGVDLRGTDLVVLSACETGVGQVHRGEGVAGIRQAFLLAGAKTVIATLWKVADQETAQLITGFFGRLGRGEEPAAALQSIQSEMIRQRRLEHRAAHPYYWAAFTLTGR